MIEARRERLPSEVKPPMKTARARRTAQDFLATPMPDEHVLEILDATRHAPSATPGHRIERAGSL